MLQRGKRFNWGKTISRLCQNLLSRRLIDTDEVYSWNNVDVSVEMKDIRRTYEGTMIKF